MNKLRLIRIYELRKQVHPIEQCVIELLDGIEKVPSNNNDYIFYKKDGRKFFSYNSKTKTIWLNPQPYRILKCSTYEIYEIMKYLLEKHLKLKFNE